jgi:hypothetical protein
MRLQKPPQIVGASLHRAEQIGLALRHRLASLRSGGDCCARSLASSRRRNHLERLLSYDLGLKGPERAERVQAVSYSCCCDSRPAEFEDDPADEDQASHAGNKIQRAKRRHASE